MMGCGIVTGASCKGEEFWNNICHEGDEKGRHFEEP